MKYPYRVKHNGIWYDANVDIPDGKSAKVEEPKAKAVVEDVKVEEPKEESTITADDINEMSRPDLLNMAREHGVKKYTTMSTDNLKKELIAVLGL